MDVLAFVILMKVRICFLAKKKEWYQSHCCNLIYSLVFLGILILLLDVPFESHGIPLLPLLESNALRHHQDQHYATSPLQVYELLPPSHRSSLFRHLWKACLLTCSTLSRSTWSELARAATSFDLISHSRHKRRLIFATSRVTNSALVWYCLASI